MWRAEAGDEDRSGDLTGRYGFPVRSKWRFPRPGLRMPPRRAQWRSRLAEGHRRRRLVLTAASTVQVSAWPDARLRSDAGRGRSARQLPKRGIEPRRRLLMRDGCWSDYLDRCGFRFDPSLLWRGLSVGAVRRGWLAGVVGVAVGPRREGPSMRMVTQ